MKTYDYMCDANGSYNGHNDGAFDDITGEVGAPWVIWVDIEVGDASISLTERGAKLGQERVAIPTGRQRGLGWRVGGHDTQPPFTASIQDNVADVRGMGMINCNRFGTDRTDRDAGIIWGSTEWRGMVGQTSRQSAYVKESNQATQ